MVAYERGGRARSVDENRTRRDPSIAEIRQLEDDKIWEIAVLLSKSMCCKQFMKVLAGMSRSVKRLYEGLELNHRYLIELQIVKTGSSELYSLFFVRSKSANSQNLLFSAYFDVAFGEDFTGSGEVWVVLVFHGHPSNRQLVWRRIELPCRRNLRVCAVEGNSQFAM
mmetsp:Transcript_3736/g.13410  ORF Transcript_3736/g.13410 Transcript_3736/m.13410 type:complete len:167 (-) Transcript_3736:1714-2214(-)